MTKNPHSNPATGTFRWPHYHYAVRYPRKMMESLGLFDGDDASQQTAPATASESGDLDPLANDDALDSLSIWGMGATGRTDTLQTLWPRLSDTQRGLALAGLSEATDSPDWIQAHVEEAGFDAESACELACNAIWNRWPDLLAATLERCEDLRGDVRRDYMEDQSESDSGDFAEIMAALSNRCIDRVLEVALGQDDESSARLALSHGADADLPVWVRERSYNHRYCALSYAIDKKLDAVTHELLERGAHAEGIPFCTYNEPLFHALRRNDVGLIGALLERGASFSAAARSAATAWNHEAREARARRSLSFRVERTLEDEQTGPPIPAGRQWADIADKSCFQIPDGQGGTGSTLLTAAASNLELLRFCRSRGLDLNTSIEELRIIMDHAPAECRDLILA